MKVDERGFEDTIEAWLLEHGGYVKSAPSHFDRVLGLDTAELFAFVGATQAKEWHKLVGVYGNDVNEAQRGFAKRLAREIDDRGTVDVLRHGVVDLGVTLQLAFFRPAHSLTPELMQRYEANRVSVTRQLAFEVGSNKTLDMALLVNGVPVATAELKNQLTGQGVEHAIVQYRTDRDPANVTLSRRAVVHFAVDPERVAMTTRLAGQATRFLPFNLGHDGGPGNPPNPAGHRTSYLWERVWARDVWMDLLVRFVHVDRPTTGSAKARKDAEVVVFPRWHQFDAVLRLEAAARAHGAGQSYLIQHSAGSGKSNTIAWTAHRLSNLHDAADRKVFDKVIVITDRVVLDRQLQETIYQFEHARGVVVKIDTNSQQLGDALVGEQARIIITTLQKFPFVLDKIADLPARRYAVIVDEAHSSQTGEAAKDLRLALGATEETELTVAEAEDAGYVAQPVDEVEEALAKAVGARGRQPNLTFVAFTATPKARTLELFGTFNPIDKHYDSFHLYSMRQAIAEGFILDVLANYVTYETFWKIEKTVTDDPQYESTKARQAIAKFVSLHPHNLAQKAEVIVEHYRQHVRHRIGGKAKAMVVTSSRLHAVRYKQALDRYIAAKGYPDVKALVAFSGKVIADGGDWTEPAMNGFPDTQTAERFASDDYQVMVVAEKYQTGFDQPLLSAMYVDKVLTGLSAVQTLSRLNRIHAAKTDTFVLDFRNDAEAIVDAFEPYYGRTIAAPTDPNLLFDTRRQLDLYDVLRPDEIQAVVTVIIGGGDAKGHGTVYAQLDPAVDRFFALPDTERADFKDALDKFVRTYSFLSQVVSFGETKLEQDYIYCRALATCLRDASTIERLDLGTEVELSHLRTEVTYEGSLSLDADTGEITAITGEGRGKAKEPDLEPLSLIIETLNERFGMQLGDADRLLLESYKAEMVADDELGAQARANTLANFRLVFEKRFLDLIIQRMDGNDALFKKVLDDDAFRSLLFDAYLADVYTTLRSTP